MRFLVDECCDDGVVMALRNDGHDVFYVAESMTGAEDEKILGLAFDEEG